MVFVTTHYMDEAEYCHRLALINRGRIVDMGTPAELKRRSIHGDLLSVECEPLAPALEGLRTVPGVRDAVIFGGGLHLIVSSAQQATPVIRAYLLERGIACSKVEHIQPTLEDVFVALTARRAAAGKESNN